MTTSYSNTGGQGDRTAIITVTSNFTPQGTMSNAVDGASGNNSTDSFGFQSGVLTGNTIRFDFGPGAIKIIDEFKWVQQNSTAQGTWKWGWSSDGSTITDLTTGIVIAGVSSTTTVSVAKYLTGARYYHLRQTAGNVSASPWVQEITFKIEDALAVLALVGVQTMAAFSQSMTALHNVPNAAVASQLINDFTIEHGPVENFVHAGATRFRPKMNTLQVGGRPRRIR